MNVGAVLVADLQAPEAFEPAEGASNLPAVAAQSVPELDAATGKARDDAPLAQGQAKVPVVVGGKQNSAAGYRLRARKGLCLPTIPQTKKIKIFLRINMYN